jgi:hypothetical protein
MRLLMRQRGAQHREQGSTQQAALRQLRQALDKTDVSGVGHGELLHGAGGFVKEIFFSARTLKQYSCQIIRVNPCSKAILK